MHIAICVWGIMRSLRYTIHSLHHFMLTPIRRSGNTYEIFMHTYNFSGVYENARNNEVAAQLNFSDWKILKPDHILVEDQDEYDKHANYTRYMSKGDPWNNDYVSFTNNLRALHALQQLAITLEKVSQQKQFDGVIYVRADVQLLHPVPFFLPKDWPATLFLPDFHRSCKGGQSNDRMALGDLQSALVYGRRIEHALAYSLHRPLHAETFLYQHLSHNKSVSVLEIPLRFRRVRSNGVTHYRDVKILPPDEYKYKCHPHRYLDLSKKAPVVREPGYRFADLFPSKKKKKKKDKKVAGADAII